MIRINLLPHREMRRERRKKDFVGICGMIAAAGAAVAILVGFGINSQISAQNERNDYISARNKQLDEEIKEIANLRSEIDSLIARQGAVESLQKNRTIPVHLFDELVKYVPEGVFLTKINQTANKINMIGQAQTNERIADFLRNLATETPWMEKPQLSKISLVKVKGRGRDPDEERQLFEFSLNAIVKTPSDKDDDAAKSKKGKRAIANDGEPKLAAAR